MAKVNKGLRVQTQRPLLRLLLEHQAEPITIERAADKLKRKPEQVRSAMRRLAGNYGVRWTREGYEMVAEPTQQEIDSIARDEKDEATYQKHVAPTQQWQQMVDAKVQEANQTFEKEVLNKDPEASVWMYDFQA